MPNLQVSGQVVNFLTHHLGFPIPSPAVLEKIGLRFRRAVTEFTQDDDIPVVRFAKGERTLEVMRPHLDRLVRAGRCGVAAIGRGDLLLGLRLAGPLGTDRSRGNRDGPTEERH